MINYSIAMHPVNANLFEINQAKGRIKAARAKGETPSAADVALVQTEKLCAFAAAQYTDVMTIEKFARHIATHGCVYSRADISAMLYLAVDCMREMLLEGRKIRLGDLGDFSVSLSSRGAETADKFSAQNITAVNVVWDCGPEFKNLLADAEFNLVAGRSAQAALLKAIKSGSSVVDLGGSTGNSTDPSDGSDDNGGDGAGSGSGEEPSTGSGQAERVFIGTSVNDAAMGSVTGTGTYDKGETVTLNTVRVLYLTLSVSIALVVGGFLVPPVGVIDGSVITAVGELLAFAVLAQVPVVIRAARGGRSITFSKGDFKVGVTSDPLENS